MSDASVANPNGGCPMTKSRNEVRDGGVMPATLSPFTPGAVTSGRNGVQDGGAIPPPFQTPRLGFRSRNGFFKMEERCQVS